MTGCEQTLSPPTAVGARRRSSATPAGTRLSVFRTNATWSGREPGTTVSLLSTTSLAGMDRILSRAELVTMNWKVGTGGISCRAEPAMMCCLATPRAPPPGPSPRSEVAASHPSRLWPEDPCPPRRYWRGQLGGRRATNNRDPSAALSTPIQEDSLDAAVRSLEPGLDGAPCNPKVPSRLCGRGPP